jgi:type I restriction enzyme S subunit
MKEAKPQLRFPGFDDLWYKQEIKNILSIGSGKDYKHLKKGNIPVFGTGGLMTRVDKYLHEGETVCIGRKGTIDKPMYYNGKIWTVDTLFYTYNFKNSIPKYVFYQFQKINWKEYNEASGVPSLSKSTIEKIEIFTTSENEQTKIANFLTSIDEKINLLKEKKSLLEDYKKGIMQKIFKQEIRFKDDNGNDFENWKITTLGEIAEIKRGAASQHLNYVNDSIEGVRLLRINDFLSDDAVYVKNTKEIQRFKVETGDLLIAGTGATAGIVFTVPEKFNNLPFSYNAPRIKIINDFNKFIYYYLKSDLILIQQKRLFVGNAQPFLDTDAMRGFIINLPSMNEQTKIASFLSAIDEKIELVATQIQDTQEYKKGLLQQMFV